MGIDYASHPSELVGSGEVGRKKIDVKALRDAIPAYCFEPKYSTSLYYLARDAVYAATLAYLAYNFIPLISNDYLRWGAWATYGVLNGFVFTGFWVLGHECGHGAFSKSDLLNNVVGLTLHSFLMTPYFAWRSTHRRHHIYANNMAKDHNYVPPEREEYAASLFANKAGIDAARLEELSEDAPIVTLLRIILQQVIGFPWYLLTNLTAAAESLPQGKPPSKEFLGNSHFAPAGVLFRKEEFGVILLSDVFLAATAAALFYAGTIIGHGNMALLWMQPYMWCNHWIVAITYLHHTHPDLPKFDNEAWSFIKGATATVDRQLGWVGLHLMHNIIEYHVVHHLFSRIPHYYGKIATDAVRPILGDAYHEDKQRAFLPGLWESFTQCQWVETANPEAESKDQFKLYHGGQHAPNKNGGDGPKGGSFPPPPDNGKSAKGWTGFTGILSSLGQKDFASKHAKTA